MAGTPGAFTTDHIPTSILYTEIMDSIERHNEANRDWKSMFCGPSVTRKSTVEMRERGMTMEESGQDTTQPDMQHIPRQTINLNSPRRWLLNASITHKAWEEGMNSTEIREDHLEALDADYRTVTESVLEEALTDGGWYSGTVIPPRFKRSTFLVTHDHYLAANVGGIPLLSHFTESYQHITEHGYPGSLIVAFINGQQSEQIVNYTEWGTAPGPMPTPVMTRLQELGHYPAFMAAGIPVYREDWIPDNYMLLVCLNPRMWPMKWRVPEQPDPAVEGLMAYTMEAHDFDMSVKYRYIEEYARWTSATIVRQGAGVAYYLGGANYVSPGGWYA